MVDIVTVAATVILVPRSDEIPHRPHQPQIFNILLTSNRTGATVCVYAMNSI